MSAVVDDEINSIRFNYTFSINAPAVLVFQGNLNDIGLGGPVSFGSSALTYDDLLWLQLESGLVGCNMSSGKVFGHVNFPHGSYFTGMHYDSRTDSVYGVMVSQLNPTDKSGNSEVVFVVSFPAHESNPQPVVGSISIPQPDRDGNMVESKSIERLASFSN